MLSEEEKLFIQLEHERMLNHDSNIRDFLHKIFSFYVAIIAAFYGGGFIICRDYFSSIPKILLVAPYILLLLVLVIVIGIVVLNIQIREHWSAKNNDAHRICLRNYLAQKQKTPIDKAPYCFFSEKLKNKDPLKDGSYNNVVFILVFMNAVNITLFLTLLVFVSLRLRGIISVSLSKENILILGLLVLFTFYSVFMYINEYCTEKNSIAEKFRSEIADSERTN